MGPDGPIRTELNPTESAFLGVISSWALRITKVMLTQSSEHPSVTS